MPLLHEKRDRLRSLVRRFESCLVAFSGGVDSALVAQVARDELGARALAVTGVSPSLARTELKSAIALAQSMGIAHQTVATEEMHRPEYRQNDPRRCFHCKNELYARLREIADQRGLAVIANGTNADDLGDYRPGIEAGAQWDVRSPLAEADLSKAEVRELARQLGVPVADKPASPCLASRIAYGEEVTEERLRRIERAEEILRTLGCSNFRVRCHADEVARIEVESESIRILASETVRRAVVEQFRELGFQFVTLDLEGFRSGSLNRFRPLPSLPIVERPAAHGAHP